ncbi:MAG: hypothetical protein ACK40S_10315 [Burkholderiaceae bacterium]
MARSLTPALLELWFKGVLCALIGAVIVVSPWVARSPSVRHLLAQAAMVGWFALVLGLAFCGRALWWQWKQRR